jgi:hypothetical protein
VSHHWQSPCYLSRTDIICDHLTLQDPNRPSSQSSGFYSTSSELQERTLDTYFLEFLGHFAHKMRTCDMRHAAHCELDALLDHGTHDITICITLPSISLTQHPIGDLYRRFPSHSTLLVDAPFLDNGPGVSMPESRITSHASLVSPAAITMRQRTTRERLGKAPNLSWKPVLQFLPNIVINLLLDFFPPSISCFLPFISPAVLF